MRCAQSRPWPSVSTSIMAVVAVAAGRQRSACTARSTVFFSRRRAFANQFDICTIEHPTIIIAILLPATGGRIATAPLQIRFRIATATRLTTPKYYPPRCKMCPFPWGLRALPNLIHGSLGLPSPHPKRRLDRFSRFAGLIGLANRDKETGIQTDHATPSIAIGRICACDAA